jgi:hypothetical protein
MNATTEIMSFIYSTIIMVAVGGLAIIWTALSGRNHN